MIEKGILAYQLSIKIMHIKMPRLKIEVVTIDCHIIVKAITRTKVGK